MDTVISLLLGVVMAEATEGWSMWRRVAAFLLWMGIKGMILLIFV